MKIDRKKVRNEEMKEEEKRERVRWKATIVLIQYSKWVPPFFVKF